MKIYKLTRNYDVIETVTLVNRAETRERYFVDNFKGVPILEWGEVEVTRVGEKMQCDLYNFANGYPIVSKKCIEIMTDHLKEAVQVLPVKYNDGGTLYILNVFSIDCLDHERSIIDRSPSGTISGVQKYSFDFVKLGRKTIFKIPEVPRAIIFVTDDFKKNVEQNGLVGFEFDEVWESDEAIVKQREETYRKALEEIDHMKGPEYTWAEGHKLLEQGRAIVSGEWKLQKREDGEIILGQLTDSGNYTWVNPAYYPPILLGMKWKETELSRI